MSGTSVKEVPCITEDAWALISTHMGLRNWVTAATVCRTAWHAQYGSHVLDISQHLPAEGVVSLGMIAHDVKGDGAFCFAE